MQTSVKELKTQTNIRKLNHITMLRPPKKLLRLSRWQKPNKFVECHSVCLCVRVCVHVFAHSVQLNSHYSFKYHVFSLVSWLVSSLPPNIIQLAGQFLSLVDFQTFRNYVLFVAANHLVQKKKTSFKRTYIRYISIMPKKNANNM